MDNEKSGVDPCYEAGLYEIRIQGQINEKRLALFEDLAVEVGADITIIRGTLPDQTALHSILARIRDMNLKLISVYQIEVDKSVITAEPRSNDGRGNHDN